MATLALDKTGTRSANLITNEEHDVSSKTKRIFVPNKGAFFGNGLVIRDKATNKILQPITGYKILHLVREAVRETNKEAFAVILILDTGVLDVVLTYQAVGGIYSNVASEIDSLLDEYLDGRTPTDTIGQIVGAPIQVLPGHHIQNIADFKQAGTALSMLEGIRKAIMLGDENAFGSVYAHIDNMFAESMKDVDDIRNYFESRYTEATTRFSRRNGSLIITDEDANPATYTEGKWQRLPNVFLYGTKQNNEVGQTIDIAEGTGLVARKTNFFVREDNGDGIIRVIHADKTAINEGDSVTFTLTTVGMSAGATLPYTISGVSAADLVSGSLTGNFVINANGIATVTVNTKRDYITEGDEILKLALTNFPNVYDSVIVRDTSQTPTYRLTLSANSVGSLQLTTVNEGGNFYVVINTTDVDPGTVLHLKYGGTATAADLSSVAPATATVDTSGTISFNIGVKEDFLTEGDETLTISVGTSASDSDIKVTSSITILDTSKTKVYNSAWSSSATGTGTISSADEGTTVYFVITTQNVINGTVLNLSYSGITAADLSDAIPTSITIYNNLAIIPVSIKADSLTEGTEILTLNVLENTVRVTSAALTINDTSRTPTYLLRYSTDTAGTDTITSANEGATVYAIVETTNIPNGTILNLSWSGVSPADLLEAPPATVTVNGNIASGKFIIKEDFTTEGPETLTMTVSDGNSVKATKNLVIIDTSVSVSGSITFSKTTAISGALSELVEDESTVYIIYTTSDIPNGTVLGVSFDGLEPADLIGTFPTTVTINSNKATISFKVTEDWLTEGDQVFTAKMLLPNGAIIQNSITVKDTSKTPVVNSMIYSTTINGSSPITAMTEDETAYLVLTTTNIPNGTVLPLAWTGTATAADFTNVRATSVTINNNTGYVTLTTKPDYLTEGAETAIGTVTLPGSNGTKAATISITDTHRVQTISIAFNTLADGSGTNVTSVNEGSTVYAVFTTTNVLDNTNLTLAWSGQVGDLSSAKPTTLSVVGNKASIAITAIADLTREGAETVTVAATTPSGANATKTLTINDTSKGYATAVWRTGTSTTSAEIPAVGANEGTDAYLHINTFGIPTNETLSITWSGTSVNANDFSATPATTMTTSSSKGYTVFKLARDYVTEGTETLNVTIKDVEGNTLVVASLKILDASMTPTFTAVFSTDAGGVNTFTSVDEPTTGVKNIYAVVKTTNMFNGDIVTFTFSGTADNNDFSGTPISTPVNVTINNNIGYYNLKLLADNADG